MTVIIIVRTKTMQVTSGKSQNGFNTDLITTWVRGRRNLVQQITRMKIEFVSLVLALITKSAELIVLPFWSHKIYHADLNSINLVTVYWILVSRQGLSLKFMWAGSHPLPLQQSLFVDCNKSSASKFERPHPLWNNHGCGLWSSTEKNSMSFIRAVLLSFFLQSYTQHGFSLEFSGLLLTGFWWHTLSGCWVFDWGILVAPVQLL